MGVGKTRLSVSKLLKKKGNWTPSEDAALLAFVRTHGEGNWNSVGMHCGLMRWGKSCRLRYKNHLRPGLLKCRLTSEEERTIIMAHALYGNQWSKIAALLPGRTDNTVKNFWNTLLKKMKRQAKRKGKQVEVEYARTSTHQSTTTTTTTSAEFYKGPIAAPAVGGRAGGYHVGSSACFGRPGTPLLNVVPNCTYPAAHEQKHHHHQLHFQAGLTASAGGQEPVRFQIHEPDPNPLDILPNRCDENFSSLRFLGLPNAAAHGGGVAHQLPSVQPHAYNSDCMAHRNNKDKDILDAILGPHYWSSEGNCSTTNNYIVDQYVSVATLTNIEDPAALDFNLNLSDGHINGELESIFTPPIWNNMPSVCQMVDWFSA